MAGQQDLQELLRMLTSRKVPMMTAMGHVKALQKEGLRSIEQLSKAALKTIETAIGDAKLAKNLHMACKKHEATTTTTTTKKRPIDDDDDDNDDSKLASSPPSKKAKLLQPHKRDLDYASMTADELETSLSLPLVEDEATIRETTVVTNRAPLLLAFAVELLRFTMPEQPPSSRLSLAQAVVSANSKAKARNLAIGQDDFGDGDSQIPEGQPTVRVLGRDVPVLKRGDYTWASAEGVMKTPTTTTSPGPPETTKTWSASQRLTSKSSTFVAHAAALTSPGQRPALMRQLMTSKPSLETATHNAWAMRARYGTSPLVQEASFDDGETGCGELMLRAMREADVGDAVVVLSRWFGGVMLGPDRWRLMRECVDDALSCRNKTTTVKLAGEAVWALDPSSRDMAIHRPEGARNYLLRSFVGAGRGEKEKKKKKKKQKKKKTSKSDDDDDDDDDYDCLGRLLGALRLLFASWAGVLTRGQLDGRAWSWYIAIRPEVEAGPAGWGAKGPVRLARICDLARKKGEEEERDESDYVNR
ncbi:hypothetical protein L249_2665 [Ophiocordyceps polyrhachis-furcata BCC 54312]|uniref:Impact N-terminal domain-containing protein n=1 Tax=Ophiocordyceps polyrhachis-furcata BCC 54312 TaxID=1330021 RepID=A0A367LPT4_9HYPO|nr:hypothetical protein L249_2665 [Ophiocordyceps polyrhachis-furcata BCC 54312]